MVLSFVGLRSGTIAGRHSTLRGSLLMSSSTKSLSDPIDQRRSPPASKIPADDNLRCELAASAAVMSASHEWGTPTMRDAPAVSGHWHLLLHPRQKFRIPIYAGRIQHMPDLDR
jgi:hypothetical protein